ncbi:MAG TPA: hypothetical protein VHE99_02085 [Gammaproteobacteria bacterium]|nr:hypothetical protein [Gammaproteobacteria bacterium]
MTTQVYTTARPRKIPFFTFDQYLDISIRFALGSAANSPAALSKPSGHNALWMQGHGIEMPKKRLIVNRKG